MISQRIGVVHESLGLGIKEGVSTASGLGFKGIQINATLGDITPENMSQSGRRELKRILSINKLRLCALGGELGAGFINENEFDFLIKKIQGVINMALDLQTNVITIQIGNIPGEAGSSHWDAVGAALKEIGAHAENYGCRLASKIRYDDYSKLKGFLSSLETKGIGLVYDPASLMMSGLDHIKGIIELHDFIELTNLWDTRQTEEGRHVEVPIGDGIVPFQEVISTLETVGYYGFYVINSNVSQQPIENIKKGKEFLERF
jgi:sugar phosphate isomerase/epimerase